MNCLNLSPVSRCRRAALRVAVIVLFAACPPLAANAADQPDGKTVLTIGGNLSGNDGKPVHFDLDGLEAIGGDVLVTTTPWTDGPQRFSGILLKRLLNHVGAEGRAVMASALNDYRTEIPLSDLDEHTIIVATRVDGKRMRVRDKGPLWIVYGDSQGNDFSLQIRNRMVWQLNRLEIME